MQKPSFDLSSIEKLLESKQAVLKQLDQERKQKQKEVAMVHKGPELIPKPQPPVEGPVKEE